MKNADYEFSSSLVKLMSMINYTANSFEASLGEYAL